MSDPTVREAADAIAAAGCFALDLEFASEGRYVPELALVQVAWGETADPQVAAFDPLALDLAPLWERIVDPAVTTLLHAGQGDLSLLAYRHGLQAATVRDTQIAAAFAGFRPQMGYGALVEELLGVRLDKSHQFTRWLARPLSAAQLRYALDDVRYLPRLWAALTERLAALGRLAWVEEESARLAYQATVRTPPTEAYLRLKPGQRLSPVELGVLRELAAWREEVALGTNKPPSWVLKDRSLVVLAKAKPASREAIAALTLEPAASAERHRGALLAAVRRGRAEPLSAPREVRLRGPAKELTRRLLERVGQRAAAAGLAGHLLASRADVEALVLAAEAGATAPPALPLFSGWRRELVGQELLVELGWFSPAAS